MKTSRKSSRHGSHRPPHRGTLLAALLVVLLSAPNAFPAPLGADRIADLPPTTRPAWEQYWDASQRLRARDETQVQDELTALGEGAQWQPAAPGRRTPGRGWQPDDDWYATPEALETARNIISFQTPAGGWSKNVSIGDTRRTPGMGFGESRAHYRGTFDNHATTSTLHILGRIAIAQDDPASQESFLKGLAYVLRAQYPNGGWPQVYPLEGGYHDNITFNDGAMIHVLRFLHTIADGDYPFVNETQRTAAREAIAKGQDCILRCQILQNDVKTVWCAQHDPLTLEPAKARSYEWPSLSGGESAGIVLYLMDHGSPAQDDVRHAVEAAYAWFRDNAIYGKVFRMRQLQLLDREGAGPLWARFYELNTGRPMFVERNAREAVYTLEELPMASNGYAWYTDNGKAVLERYPSWKAAQPAGIDSVRATEDRR